ncbi:PQQ-binding-like beta-propeller repeat protein [Streptomyces sp. NPDC087420]|uniref:outer membrane protein assembly factor BamB family protein n=1 Tax=Streptomyces sp. NPDC087420 TaxID=3365785 RepID=UPI0038373CA7
MVEDGRGQVDDDMGRLPGISGRARRRPRPGLLLILVLVIVAAIAASFVVLPRYLEEDDKATAKRPPSGMAPGRFAGEWKAQVEGGAPLGYHEPTGSLFLWFSDRPASPAGLFVLDAKSGKRKWQSPVNWDIEIEYLPVDPVLGDVVVVAGKDPYGESRLAGLGIRDGKLLWSRPFPQIRPEMAFSDGFVVMQTDESSVRAIGAARGTDRWKWSAPAGCSVVVVHGSDQLVVVETLCGERRDIRSLDRADGHELWKRRVDMRVGSEYSPNWGVRGGLVGLTVGEQMWAYNARGKTVFDKAKGASCGVGADCFAAGGDVGVLRFASGDDNIVQAVDLSDGKPLWRHHMTADVLQVRGDSLHIFGRFPEPLFPHFLATVDLRTGTYLLSATPAPAPDATGDDFIGVVRNRVLMNESLGSFTAYRTVPAAKGFFGGALPDAWPDACRMLRPQAVADVMGDVHSYAAVPERLAFLGSRLPRPTVCRYRPDPVDGPLVSARIVWVAPTEEDAAGIMDRFVEAGGVTQHPGVGDAAAQRMPWQGQEEQTVYFRVGRYLAAVSVEGQADRAPELAKRAAEGLRRLS